jgi:hypothetical protein
MQLLQQAIPLGIELLLHCRRRSGIEPFRRPELSHQSASPENWWISRTWPE